MKRRYYDWGKWFKKVQFTLEQGKDYDCQIHGMASQIRNKATKLGVFVKLKIDGTIITVTRKD